MEKFDFLCFGGGDWWYHNRGHIDMQLMRRFARRGTVLYVNSIVMQKPKMGQGRIFVKRAVRKLKSIIKGLQKTDAGFWVYSPFSLPVHHIPWLRGLNEILLRGQLWVVMLRLGMRNPLVWVICPASCNVAIKMKKKKLAYGRIDRWEEYPNVDVDTIIQYDRKLKANADLTMFVSEFLYEQEHQQCKKAFFLDHGVDFDIFARSESDEELPPDIRDIKHPIIGFFGGIDDHTSDMNFLKGVINLLPEMNFVFVGKASVDCTGLLSQKNVRMLGQKPYEQIPHYGKCFDVAIMPWRQNHWIEACNPIKLKEYLALGKPIVSTPFAELQKYRDVVYVAKTVNEFADCIKRALSENTPELALRRKQKVAHASWDSKAELALHELISEKGSKPEPLAHDVKKTLYHISQENPLIRNPVSPWNFKRREISQNENYLGADVRTSGSQYSEEMSEQNKLAHKSIDFENVVKKLCSTAKKGLAKFYSDVTKNLPYTNRLCSDGICRPEGFSIRYAAISQIGIAKWLQYHSDDRGNLPELWPNISDSFKNITDIGDIALSLWAGIQSCADNREKFAQALKENWPIQSARCNAVELGWVVQACLMAQQTDSIKTDLKPVLDDSHRQLISLFDAGSRLFYKHHRPGLMEIIGRYISCFADQVYPIVALSNYGLLYNHSQSIDFAAQATEKICQYQGELGQWWWHYDVTHKRICEEYPVFSVHQDSMAPMAVMASDRASKQNHSDKIGLGLQWNFGFNELGENLVHPESGIIWRDIERNEPAELSRKIRCVCSVTGLSGLHRLTGKCVRGFRVNRECRPYHLGWILYVWADHKAI